MDEKLQVKLARAFKMAIGAIETFVPELEAAVVGLVILNIFDDEELNLIDSTALKYGEEDEANGETV